MLSRVGYSLRTLDIPCIGADICGTTNSCESISSNVGRALNKSPQVTNRNKEQTVCFIAIIRLIKDNDYWEITKHAIMTEENNSQIISLFAEEPHAHPCQNLILLFQQEQRTPTPARMACGGHLCAVVSNLVPQCTVMCHTLRTYWGLCALPVRKCRTGEKIPPKLAGREK